MSYRIEISPNNRAGCMDAVCKAEGVKIMKGEIRLGNWVEIPALERGSWKWRHWGCVSGLSIEHIRDKIAKGDEYQWDAIDGYDELNEHPEIQEKIRRVIEQGHIDPEDFNGDPEYNHLGSRGIRGRKTKKAADGEEEEKDGTDTKGAKSGAAKKRGGTKRGHQADEEEEEAASPPKKRATRGKKAVTEAEAPKEVEPTPKGKRGAKKASAAAKEEPEPEPPKKAAGRAKKDAKSSAPEPAPAAKSAGRPKRGVKAAEAAKEEEKKVAAKAEAPKKRGRRSAA